MPKFNIRDRGTTARSPVRVADPATPTLVTHEGAPAYARTAQADLFLLGMANLVGEDTFYESAAVRDGRYRTLVHQVAVESPRWLYNYVTWLRRVANMRSAPLVAALEGAAAMLSAPDGSPVDTTPPVGGRSIIRALVSAPLARADEPGEAVAYWERQYGRAGQTLTAPALPKPVKRGLADAVVRLYTQRALLKYDTPTHGKRFADVIELVHPSPDFDLESLPADKLQDLGAAGEQEYRAQRIAEQSDLFRYALDRRHGHRDGEIPQSLWMIRANMELRGKGDNDPAWLDPRGLARAGMNWEDALPRTSGVDQAQVWAALAPSMGYMALLRNLRNMDQAGVNDEVAGRVAAKLANPDEVAASRQLPFRFWAAYVHAPAMRWGPALESALNLVCGNIPELPGRTLILIDTSASMSQNKLSAKSTMTSAQAAALFGVAAAVRNAGRADVFGFADGQFRFEVKPGSSVLRRMEAFDSLTGRVGHGTQIAAAVQACFKGHDRIIIFTDEQTFGPAGRPYAWHGNVTEAAPSTVPMYVFNLGGYAPAAVPSGYGKRHELGGLSDATFRMIPLLEQGGRADWPWAR